MSSWRNERVVKRNSNEIFDSMVDEPNPVHVVHEEKRIE
jgi:hypothetical protein